MNNMNNEQNDEFLKLMGAGRKKSLKDKPSMSSTMDLSFIGESKSEVNQTISKVERMFSSEDKKTEPRPQVQTQTQTKTQSQERPIIDVEVERPTDKKSDRSENPDRMREALKPRGRTSLEREDELQDRGSLVTLRDRFDDIEKRQVNSKSVTRVRKFDNFAVRSLRLSQDQNTFIDNYVRFLLVNRRTAKTEGTNEIRERITHNSVVRCLVSLLEERMGETVIDFLNVNVIDEESLMDQIKLIFK